MSDHDAYQIRATREMQNNIQHRDRVEARLERIEHLLLDLIGRITPEKNAAAKSEEKAPDNQI